MGAEHIGLVRDAFAAAFRGDFGALSGVLANDVRWRGAGDDPNSGCTNREQALDWIRQAVTRGVSAEVLEVRAVDEDRVLVVLRRNAPREDDQSDGGAAPHGQIVTFRDGKVSEIIVYPSEDEAIQAARGV